MAPDGGAGEPAVGVRRHGAGYHYHPAAGSYSIERGDSMNRNTLLIAIAAIAAVGIVAGLFLAGAGQNPLSGTLVKQNTQITCGASIVEEAGIGGYLLNLHGKLGTAAGTGLAGKTVTLYYKYPTMSAYEPLPTVTTGADGTYSYLYEELPYYGNPVLYYARFAGDDLYNGSQSPSTHW